MSRRVHAEFLARTLRALGDATMEAATTPRHGWVELHYRAGPELKAATIGLASALQLAADDLLALLNHPAAPAPPAAPVMAEVETAFARFRDALLRELSLATSAVRDRT